MTTTLSMSRAVPPYRTPSECAFPVYRTEPPYGDLQPAYLPVLQDDALRPGTVMALRLAGTAPHHAALPEAIRALGLRFPSAPLVLWVPAPSADLGRFAAEAASLGARALLVDAAMLRETLAPALTHPLDLGSDVVGWLTLRGLRLSPALAHVVRQIFNHAPRHVELSGLLKQIGESEATTRFRFRKKSLPAPGRWHQLARALHLALRIQAEPKTSLLQLAQALGHADHSAASQLLFRTLRLRPGAIRGTLGWEWLLARWFAHVMAVQARD